MPALIINIINNIAELLTIVIGLSAMQGRKLKIDGMLILLILYDNIVIIGINEFDLPKSFLLYATRTPREVAFENHFSAYQSKNAFYFLRG